MTSFVRSLLAALLLAVPVAAESLGPISGDDRTTETLFILGQLVGWGLVATVVRDLGRVAGRSSRWGLRLTMAGVVLQLVFAVLYLGSLVATGDAWEGSFFAFLLGFLGLTVGGILWAVRLRRGPQRTAALGLAAVAGLGLVAIAAGDNVVHEVALVGSYLAWVLVGRGVTSETTVARPVTAGSR
jgi:hypothetical protein